MSFTHQRTVRFQDTDAAGVVYFANVLAMCHEAYEASLMSAGIDLKEFFGGSEVAVPIVHADVDFLQPLRCGDRLSIQLTPHLICESEFEVFYEIRLTDRERLTCKAHTRHVCIEVASRPLAGNSKRARQVLPDHLNSWLQSIS